MDTQEIKTLKILEAIEENQDQNQRDLAKRLGISLGLVNSLLKATVKKGYFKVKAVPKNRIKYSITPKGFAEKIELTYRYLSYALGYYIEIKDKICEVIDTIALTGQKNILIYGASEIAEITCVILREYDLNLIGIVDENKAGEKLFGLTVASLSALNRYSFDAIIIAHIESSSKENELISRCGIHESQIYKV